MLNLLIIKAVLHRAALPLRVSFACPEPVEGRLRGDKVILRAEQPRGAADGPPIGVVIFGCGRRLRCVPCVSSERLPDKRSAADTPGSAFGAIQALMPSNKMLDR